MALTNKMDKTNILVKQLKEFSSHNILVETPHIQSLASLKKLLAYYIASERLPIKELHTLPYLQRIKKLFVEKMAKLGPLKCFYCQHILEQHVKGDMPNYRWAVTVDHIIPLCRNVLLAFDTNNMRLACGLCNSKKSYKRG